MPIYTYRCSACGHEFERLVRSGTSVACPDCDGRRLKRLMSLPAPPAGAAPADYSRLGPPSAGGCCGGGCHSHNH